MITSIEFKTTNMRYCQAIVVACSVLNAFDFRYVDAFSVQWNFNGHQRAQNRKIANDSMNLKNRQNSQRDTILYEQSVAPVQNDASEESNFVLTMERSQNHEGLEFQSQPNLQNDRLADTSSAYPQSSPSHRNSRKLPIDNRINDLQMMALKSKISKYMTISPRTLTTETNSPEKTKRIIVLWRNLLNDTPELTGYPIHFLSEKMKSIMRNLDLSSNQTTTTLSSTEMTLQHVSKDAEIDWDFVLPYIDAYTFEVGGGVTGLVYGVSGIADGTQICTTSVGDVQSTIPRNYIQTGDGCIYELGRPAFSNDSVVQTATQSYSLSGTSKHWFRDGKETASLIAKKTRIPAFDDNTKNESIIDSDLLQLAGLTALVLTGSMAMETLSHHLTVNVFWV